MSIEKFSPRYVYLQTWKFVQIIVTDLETETDIQGKTEES